MSGNKASLVVKAVQVKDEVACLEASREGKLVAAVRQEKVKAAEGSTPEGASAAVVAP